MPRVRCWDRGCSGGDILGRRPCWTPLDMVTLSFVADGLAMGGAADTINCRLPAALAHLGRLQPTLVAVRRKRAVLRSLGLRAAGPADAGLTLEDLLAWYQRRFGPISDAAEAHARDLGVSPVEKFVAEVVLEDLAERSAGTSQSG